MKALRGLNTSNNLVIFQNADWKDSPPNQLWYWIGMLFPHFSNRISTNVAFQDAIKKVGVIGIFEPMGTYRLAR